MTTLTQLQQEVEVWTNHNFDRDGHNSWSPLLGIVEEVGELCHAHLKQHQGIRGYDDPVKFLRESEDAVGDALVYMADYCNEVGIDLQEALDATWSKVQKRDWVEDKALGGQGGE